MYKIVMIRHGESVWNQENRFTGWTDVELTPKGVSEASLAGEALKKENFIFDIAYTSLLRRAIKTLNVVLDVMDQLWIPVVKDWRLNERHYGSLQGLNKSETAKKYGEDQVKIWRRSYDVPPPAIDETDERFPGKCPQYASLLSHQLPRTECLKDTVERFLPFWHETIVPSIKKGERVVIAAHGNSIRAAVKYLDAMSEHDIVSLNIPTGIPLVYELDDTLKPIKHYYIGDEEAIRQAAEAVANQGSA